jgi:AcrR family transcriptional regulator
MAQNCQDRSPFMSQRASSPTVTPDCGHGAPAASARHRIVAQSLALFSDRGYNGVSMSEIASAAGITKAALYYHFADKEELFLEAVITKTARLAAELERIIESTDELNKLLYDIALFLLDDGLGEYRRLHLDLLTIVPEARRKASLRQVGDLLMTLAPRLRSEQRQGRLRDDMDIDATMPLYFAMIGGQIRRLATSPSPGDEPVSNKNLAALIVELWLHGTSARHQPGE